MGARARSSSSANGSAGTLEAEAESPGEAEPLADGCAPGLRHAGSKPIAAMAATVTKIMGGRTPRILDERGVILERSSRPPSLRLGRARRLGIGLQAGLRQRVLVRRGLLVVLRDEHHAV